jgi:thioester reductase-like protein
MDRVMKETFQSPCFDRCRDLPNFETMIREKIFPIEGDINKEGLALKEEDRELLKREVQVIINCAASVDFNEQLTDAISVNYLGCLLMLSLAHSCSRLEIFTHVSTAYVNCEKKGYIKE